MKNTGNKGYDRLKQKNTTTGVYTGVTKANTLGDPDYIAPVYDASYCKVGEWYINLDFPSIQKSANSGNVTLQIYSNTEWRIVTTSYWVGMNGSILGTHDGIADVNISANPLNVERTGVFEIRSLDDSIIKEFSIYQAAAIPVETIKAILLAKSSSSRNTCSNADSGFYSKKYIDGYSLSDSTNLYLDGNGFSYATSGWYSDGFKFRYWTGSSFYPAGVCKFFIPR